MSIDAYVDEWGRSAIIDDYDGNADLDCLARAALKAMGMPIWQVSEPYMSLWLHDQPLGYQPAIGPKIELRLDFKQRESTAGLNPNIFSIGKRWNMSWLSYVERDFYSSNVVHFADGGTRTFYGTNDFKTRTTLTGDSTNGFTLSYPDGHQDIYGFIVTNRVGKFLRAFMTEHQDSDTRKMLFEYGSYDPGSPSIQLQRVIDGDGRTNFIYYSTSNAYSANLIAKVVDPFGRSASFAYDSVGRLTNIVDAAQLATALAYDDNDWVTNMVTPYGKTTFVLTESKGADVPPNGRSVLVTEPDGSRQLFLATNNAPGIASSYSTGEVPVIGSFTNSLETSNLNLRNSFHWGRLQYQNLSTTNVSAFSSADFKKARMRHWLQSADAMVGEVLSLERLPGPNGVSEGQKLWYDYSGKTNAQFQGDQSQPLVVAQVLPDGTSQFVRTERNSLGFVTRLIETWSAGAGSPVLLRTNQFLYSTNLVDLLAITNAAGVLASSNVYNEFHQITTNYNALGEQSVITYNAKRQMSSLSTPAGLLLTNTYFVSGDASNHLATIVQYSAASGTPIFYSTNSYTWSNDLVLTHTDPRGLTVTNTWDSLQRLRRVDFPDGTYVTNVYDKLDLVSVVDRMGFTSGFAYSPVRQMIAATNANNVVTLYEYCSCGALLSVTNGYGTPVQSVTRFTYDNQGNRLTSTGPDGFVTTFNYDILGRLTNAINAISSVTNWYNNQGVICAASNALGRVIGVRVDELDRAVYATNVNNVVVASIYDKLGRIATNSYPDGGLERFGYTPNVAGLTSYTNQNGSNVVNYTYDPLGRKTIEVYPDVSTNLFGYNGAGDLVTLTNGKGNVTTWTYDIYGRTSSKVGADGNTNFIYTYFADGRLHTRWTPAKATTTYGYDRVGNLTNVVYPTDPTVTLYYDALNRVTNMVDAIGSTRFNYDVIGQLLSEDGPWGDDTLNFTYSNRRRSSLSLQAPNSSPWTQTYGYNAANQLTNITSAAGTFQYSYDNVRRALVNQIRLPNSAYITNSFDAVARLTGTWLRDSSGAALNTHDYVYDLAGQRTEQIFTAGNYVDYTYDNSGQLRTAFGKEAVGGTNRFNERFSYQYDPAGNLSVRANNDLVQTFAVDSLNQLTTVARNTNMTVAGTTTSHATSVTVNGGAAILYNDATFARTNFGLVNGNNTFTAIAQDAYGRQDTNTVTAYLPVTTVFVYDANGNLRTNGQEILVYDEENRLVTNYVAGSWKSEFVYDGLNRRRLQRDYAWSNGGWTRTNETRLIYDGNVIVQHRDANNLPTLALTRGLDLSGSLQGAGGIGGLLAMTENPGVNPEHSYYHCGAGGNVAFLLSPNQHVVAKAEYDPYGGFISLSGPKASANPYWFSSKPIHFVSRKYDFLYRWYAPNLQRWITRDPIQERGGINLFAYSRNNPTTFSDPTGRHPLLIIAAVLVFSALSTDTSPPPLPGPVITLAPAYTPNTPILRDPGLSPLSYNALLYGSDDLVGTRMGPSMAEGYAISILSAPGTEIIADRLFGASSWFGSEFHSFEPANPASISRDFITAERIAYEAAFARRAQFRNLLNDLEDMAKHAHSDCEQKAIQYGQILKLARESEGEGGFTLYNDPVSRAYNAWREAQQAEAQANIVKIYLQKLYSEADEAAKGIAPPSSGPGFRYEGPEPPWGK